MTLDGLDLHQCDLSDALRADDGSLSHSIGQHLLQMSRESQKLARDASDIASMQDHERRARLLILGADIVEKIALNRQYLDQ